MFFYLIYKFLSPPPTVWLPPSMPSTFCMMTCCRQFLLMMCPVSFPTAIVGRIDLSSSYLHLISCLLSTLFFLSFSSTTFEMCLCTSFLFFLVYIGLSNKKQCFKNIISIMFRKNSKHIAQVGCV